MSLDVFGAMADPTRRRILELVAGNERTVGELVFELGMEQTAVSKHLRILRDLGFVDSRAVGRQRLYRLQAGPLDEAIRWLSSLRSPSR